MWEAAFGEILTYEQPGSEAKRLIAFFLTLAEERIEIEVASACEASEPGTQTAE
jgi:hypothetical protein